MPSDRRHRTVSERDSYTNIQQHKRNRCGSSTTSSQDGNMSDRQCSSLIPSATDYIQQSPTSTPWKGWQKLSPTSPCTNSTVENQEFPPLTSKFDSDMWYTPQPIKNWADHMDEVDNLPLQNEKKENVKPVTNTNKGQRFKRKLELPENGRRPARPQKTILTDEHRLAQRQKQIDIGKNTSSYGRYISEIPRHCRQITDPRTPDKFQICSTRSWTGQVKIWRRRLHEWDTPTEGKVNPFSLFSNSDVADAEMDTKKSASSTNSSQDFFSDLNLDECLLQDNLP